MGGCYADRGEQDPGHEKAGDDRDDERGERDEHEPERRTGEPKRFELVRRHDPPHQTLNPAPTSAVA